MKTNEAQTQDIRLFPDSVSAPRVGVDTPEFEAFSNSRIPGEEVTEEWLAGAFCALGTCLGPGIRLLLPDERAYCPNFSVMVRTADGSDPYIYERIVGPLYDVHFQLTKRHAGSREGGRPLGLMADFLKPEALFDALGHGAHGSTLVATYVPRHEKFSPLEAYRYLKIEDQKAVASAFSKTWRPKTAQNLENGDWGIGLGAFLPVPSRHLTTLSISPLVNSDSPPPVLLLTEKTPREPVPAAIVYTDEAWVRLVHTLLDFPDLGQRLLRLELSQEALELYTKFHRELDGRVVEAMQRFRPHLVWLPELGLKIATIIHMLHGEDGAVSGDTMENAVEIVKWLGNAHFGTLQGVLPASPMPDAPDDPCATDTAKAVLRKICQKYPVSPRDLLRSFHGMRASERDEAIGRLFKAGMVRWRGDGKLEPCAPYGPHA